MNIKHLIFLAFITFLLYNCQTESKDEKSSNNTNKIEVSENQKSSLDIQINKADKYVYGLLAIYDIPDKHKLFILMELLNKI